jgi:hypothetical protein
LAVIACFFEFFRPLFWLFLCGRTVLVLLSLFDDVWEATDTTEAVAVKLSGVDILELGTDWKELFEER